MTRPKMKKSITESIAGLWLPRVEDTKPNTRGPATAEDFPARA
jgi:hypothetical protein